jgi:hypothetical protein
VGCGDGAAQIQITLELQTVILGVAVVGLKIFHVVINTSGSAGTADWHEMTC